MALVRARLRALIKHWEPCLPTYPRLIGNTESEHNSAAHWQYQLGAPPMMVPAGGYYSPSE